MKPASKSQWSAALLLSASALALCAIFFFSLVQGARAAEAELRPGDAIGPHNWQRVEGMVGQNLLNRIKQGYAFKLKGPKVYGPLKEKVYGPLKEYVEATEKYAGKVTLGRHGELLHYVAGLPFPRLAPSDPQAGVKIAWNFYWRWLGDDQKTGGATREGKIIRDAIERDGSERRVDIVSYTLRTRGRVTIEPIPVISGYEHIDWMHLRADEYPRDTSGTTTLEIRYADPNRADDLYIYVPSLRRVRRAPPIQRCATIAPGEYNFDDINSFNGKITDFNYRFLGEKKMLANLSQERLPFRRKRGDYLPLDEGWEVRDAYLLEITPKDPDYCYPRKVVAIDRVMWDVFWTMTWDKDGNYWREQFAFRTPVRLPDGREVWSVGTVVFVNVQNGRATVLTVPRAYNQGYQPTLFSLATLQQVMRGGSIR